MPLPCPHKAWQQVARRPRFGAASLNKERGSRAPDEAAQSPRVQASAWMKARLQHMQEEGLELQAPLKTAFFQAQI